MNRHGEAQANAHAGRIRGQRRLEKVANLGELNDRIHLGVNLGSAHAKNDAIEVDVLSAGHVRMHAGTQCDQPTNSPPEGYFASVGGEDPIKYAEKRRLAGTVLAYDAQGLAVAKVKAHVSDGPEFVLSQDRRVLPDSDQIAGEIFHAIGHAVAEVAAELLGDAAHA